MRKKHAGLEVSSSVGQVSWIFLSILIITIIFALGIYATNQTISHYYNTNTNRLYLASNLKKALNQGDDSMQEYLQTGNRASLVRYNDAIRLFQDNWDELASNSTFSQEMSLLRSISDAFYSYQDSSNIAAFAYYEEEFVRSYENLQKAQSISRYLEFYCDELLDAQISSGYTNELKIQRMQKGALLLNVASVMLLTGMSLLGLNMMVEEFQRPLNQLYNASLDVSAGNYNIRIPEDYQDGTMEQLARSFNQMTRNIQNMVRELEVNKQLETSLLNEKLKNTKYEYLLEQANFLALQSQANPHFLFNTLNSISRTITLDRSNDAVMMIDALTGLLRYNLQDATRPATLAEEMQVIEQYMMIQGYRFQDRIQAQFIYDEVRAASVNMPRFTLQPIVENAIIHGLEPKISVGTLWITVTYPGGLCQIDIRDDGVGIAPDKLQKLLDGKMEGRAGHTTSIGISNTRQRLEIYTHRKDSLSIWNHPDGGTLVRITLPLTSET